MIVVAGSLAFDYIMNFPGYFKDHILPEKIHILNLSFKTEKLNKNFGGSAGNIAYNLSLFKMRPTILATAGKDFTSYRKFLNKANIETRYIKSYKNEFTSNYFGVVDQSDNQIGGFYAGAMSKATTLSLKAIKEKINFVSIAPTEPQAMTKLALECKNLKIPYIFDASKALPRFTNSQLLKGIEGAEIFIGNDYEIGLTEKKLKLTKVQLLKKVRILITTFAHKGSMIEAGNKKIRIKIAKPKNTSDPIGAGDAYQAGFIAGYLRDLDLKTCGRMGSVTAAYTVEKYGTTTHRFTKKQFCDRFRKNFNKQIKI